MCGGEHLFPNCKLVEDYIKMGKCRGNQEGKVVLPTGSYVPQAITGRHLAEQIDKWHTEHPNQLAAATLIHTIDRQVITNAQAISTIQSPTRSTYTLSSNECIATLEAKLFNLRQNKNTSIAAVKTRAQ